MGGVVLARIFDLMAIFLALSWISGGWEWNGKAILSHSPDVRRALVIFLFSGICFRPFSEKSFVLQSLRTFFQALQTSKIRYLFFGMMFFLALLVAVVQAAAMRYALYDVGIFHQIIWALSEGYGFLSTISGAGNFLRDHFSPSLAILAPFLKLFGSSAYFLPVAQVVLIYLGIFSWMYFAERVPGVDQKTRTRLAAATVLFGTCFGSLWANQRWGFHENSIYFASLSWALVLFFLRVGSDWRLKRFSDAILIFVLLLISAGTKEILILNVMVFLMIWVILMIRHRGPQLSVLPPFLFAILLFSVFIYFESLPKAEDKNYFVRYYSYLGNDLSEFLATLVFSPWRVVQTIGFFSLLQYVSQVLLPFLALPLVFLYQRLRKGKGTRRFTTPAFLLVMVPSFLSSAIATYPPLRDPSFHYVLELWPVLAVFTVIALAQLNSNRVLRLWIVLAFLGIQSDPFQDLRGFWKEAVERSEVRQKIAEIPQDETVVSSELGGTWVSSRKIVTRWKDLRFHPQRCPDWILLQETQYKLEELEECPSRTLELVWTHADWRAYRLR